MPQARRRLNRTAQAARAEASPSRRRSSSSRTAREAVVAGEYAHAGHETLTYEQGNRGVRYIFRKISGDAGAPQFIQFSDHAIAPVKAGHYHLYWGKDRAALLNEITNWPTFYPAMLDGTQFVAEMMAH